MSNFTSTVVEKTFVSKVEVMMVRQDHRFVNFWNKPAGLGRDGLDLPVKAQIRVRRLAFQTMRQIGLTGAGHDYQWFSVKVPGQYVFHIREDDGVVYRGKRVSAAEFFDSL